MQKIIIQLTQAQYDALKALPLVAGEDRSKMIRRLLESECAKHEIIFPQDMPTPSRKRKITGEQRMETRLVIPQANGAIEDVIAKVEASYKNSKILRHYVVDGSYIIIIDQPYEDWLRNDDDADDTESADFDLDAMTGEQS